MSLSSHTGSCRLRKQTSDDRKAEHVLLPRKQLAPTHHYLLIPNLKINCRNTNRRDKGCILRCFFLHFSRKHGCIVAENKIDLVVKSMLQSCVYYLSFVVLHFYTIILPSLVRVFSTIVIHTKTFFVHHLFSMVLKKNIYFLE